MILRKSIASDVKELTSISTKAFDTDVLVGGPENDGPPGYNSEGWHREMMEQNHLYTYICEDETIVGGAVIFGRDELFVGRIFMYVQEKTLESIMNAGLDTERHGRKREGII